MNVVGLSDVCKDLKIEYDKCENINESKQIFSNVNLV